MIPDERRYSTKWFYQCIQSRYGFNPHHLMLADACEFFIGQGCKVGLGRTPDGAEGHRPGRGDAEPPRGHRPALPRRVIPTGSGPTTSRSRSSRSGRRRTGRSRLQLKLGAARVYDDVRMAVKCDPDSIYIDGMEGGHRGRAPPRDRGDRGAGDGGHPPGAPGDRRPRQAGARSPSSTRAASATAGTSPRPSPSARTGSPSGTRC